MKAKFLPLIFLGAACGFGMAQIAQAKHHHDGFSISMTVPNPPPAFDPDDSDSMMFAVNNRNHHNHQPYWVDMVAGQPLPANAVVGGYQPEPRFTLYVCRASFRGGVHPGKLIGANCNIGWGGQEYSLPRYQVLVSKRPLSWAPSNNGFVPPNAIDGGYQQDQQLNICQVNYMGGTHPGKVVGGNCNIGWGGQEVAIPYYNVLVG